MTHTARAKRKAQLPGIRRKISEEIDVWAAVYVGKWQRAFSQVVADGRFAVIGLVALGLLASVAGALRVPLLLNELAQKEVELVLERFEREEWGGVEDGVRRGLVGMDQGVPIEREDVSVEQVAPLRLQSRTSEPHSSRQPSTEPVLSSKRNMVDDPGMGAISLKKRKKKKGNAIDDLFSSL